MKETHPNPTHYRFRVHPLGFGSVGSGQFGRVREPLDNPNYNDKRIVEFYDSITFYTMTPIISKFPFHSINFVSQSLFSRFLCYSMWEKEFESKITMNSNSLPHLLWAKKREEKIMIIDLKTKQGIKGKILIFWVESHFHNVINRRKGYSVVMLTRVSTITMLVLFTT